MYQLRCRSAIFVAAGIVLIGLLCVAVPSAWAHEDDQWSWARRSNDGWCVKSLAHFGHGNPGHGAGSASVESWNGYWLGAYTYPCAGRLDKPAGELRAKNRWIVWGVHAQAWLLCYSSGWDYGGGDSTNSFKSRVFFESQPCGNSGDYANIGAG